ncbi:zinc finger protein 782-like [Anopheles bellator]|uniref:zinc finger protein 782-like n=1 Tax=Anopheles bellator TaxID=139047 RepID=UPI002647B3EC|nr:zinc finger protein 782-like [Anopheles bellator]
MESRYCRVCLTAVGVCCSVREPVNKTLSLLDVLRTICPKAFISNEHKQWPTKICGECKRRIIEANELYDLCMTSVECLAVLYPDEQCETSMANTPKNQPETFNDWIEQTKTQICFLGFDDTKGARDKFDGISCSTVKPNDRFDGQLQQIEEDANKSDGMIRSIGSQITVTVTSSVTEDNINSNDNSTLSDESDYGIEALPYTNVISQRKQPTNEHLCSFCEPSIIFASPRDLSDHLKSMHKDMVHCCNLCDMLFVGIESLEKHDKFHAMGLNYFCTVCEQGFITREALKNHLPTHTCSLLCSHCGKTFPDNSKRAAHIRYHHSNLIKSYACSFCPAKFKMKGNLKTHEARHTKYKRYCCELCGKQLSSKEKLQLHHRMVHEKERPYKCTVCHHRCSYARQLRVHMNTHTGEKPHQCYFCDRKYSNFSDLKDHLSKHIGDKIYPCHRCEASFKLKSELRDHCEEHFQGGSPSMLPTEGDFRFALSYLLSLRYPK